jgi:hypothetical protein
MFTQVNDEGNRHVCEEIIDHQTDGSEIKQQDAFHFTAHPVEQASP